MRTAVMPPARRCLCRRTGIYASLMRYGSVDGVVKATKRALDRGYRYIKLHEIGLDEIRAAAKTCAGKAKVMIEIPIAPGRFPKR